MKLLCRLVPLLLVAACGKTGPIPYESIAWVNNYYIEHPVASLSATAGGWLFRGAKDFQGELRVGYLVPGPIPGDEEKREAILSMICPPKFEKIWEILPSKHKLMILVWTEDNSFKDSIDC